MATEPVITTESFPGEYNRPPVYGRVPSIEAIERYMTTPRMTPAQAMKDELSAATREALRS